MSSLFRIVAAPAAICAGLLTLAGPTPVRAVPGEGAPRTADLPFFAGEQLTFLVRVGGMGTVGRGSMSVEAPVLVRNRSTLPVRFDFSTRVGPVRAEDRTQSWIDTERMSSLRFYKKERHPMSSHDELVELFPLERRWNSANGESGVIPTDAPLDELSFLYFVRTLDLVPGRSFEFNRHFEPGRNPVGVRVLRRETITVPAGEFRTLVVEMRVRDPRRYRGEGTLRLFVTDDECRIPVRMESSLPVLGSMVLTLESHTHPADHPQGH